MKWILVPLLWLLAMTVALLILFRWWRGRNLVLNGRWSPRFVRMVAVVLVMLGVSAEESRPASNAAPAPDDKQGKTKPAEDLPSCIHEKSLQKWLAFQNPGNELARIKQGYLTICQTPGQPNDRTLLTVQTQARATLPEKFRELFLAEVDARATGKKSPAVRANDLLTAMDQLEQAGCFDHWINAFLWQKTALVVESEPRQLVQVYSRIHRHARLTNALIAAQAQVRPLFQHGRAWTSKAGRPLDRELALAEADPRQMAIEMAKTLPKLYPQADAGSWQQDGHTLFTVPKDSAPITVIRGGQGRLTQDNPAILIGRLDLIETVPSDRQAKIQHAWLGEVQLPAGRVISPWDLPAFLSEEGKTKLNETVAHALEGNAAAANRLEKALPLAHAALREALAKSPTSKGAPRMRLILSLFDDVVPFSPREPLGEELVPDRRVPARIR